jgi:tetratricopeptide (TPR) repeat protein
VIDRARLVLGADDPDLYSALNDLGLVYEGMDKGRPAVAALVEALEGRSRLLGPRDPRVLVTTSNLAQAYDRIGDTARSLELQLGALRIAEAIPDPPHMVLLGLYNNIGATYQDLNREREAEPYLRRAVELASEWLGPESDDTLTIKANLASLEAKLGDPLEGAAVYETLIDARTRQLGPDALGTLTARYGYWDCLWLAREFDEAAEGYTALLPDMVRALGETHWLTIQTRASLAHALRDGGHPDQALLWAKLAAEQFEALYGRSHARTINAVELFNQLKTAQAKSDG